MRLLLLSLFVCALTVMNARSQSYFYDSYGYPHRSLVPSYMGYDSWYYSTFGSVTVQSSLREFSQSSSQGVLVISGSSLSGDTLLSGGDSLGTLSLAPGAFLYAPDSSSNISTVPEPTTALLVLGGLALLWLQSRRSRRVIWG